MRTHTHSHTHKHTQGTVIYTRPCPLMELIRTCASTQSSINSTGEKNLEGAVTEVDRGGNGQTFMKNKQKKI